MKVLAFCSANRGTALRWFSRHSPPEVTPAVPEPDYELIPKVRIPLIIREEDNAPVAYFGELASGDCCTPEEALRESLEARMETLGSTEFNSVDSDIKELDFSRIDDIMSRLTS